jgi:3-hydroxyacyl-CoA dehydrogenase
MTVELSIDDRVAVIRLAHPPVNSLGRSVRQGLLDAFQAAAQDPEVEAIVLYGGDRVFSAGADITEFASGASGDALAEPTLPSVIDAIEASTKPVVAAIAGACLGGGFELALGCHRRILAPNARVALPEIKLGLLPGAGGTQRLPRLIGPERALEMIVSGQQIDAATAVALGIGQASSGDLRADAAALARGAIGQAPDRLSQRAAALTNPAEGDAYWAAQHKKAAMMGPAAAKCVEAVRAAVALPFADGRLFENACFVYLLQTSEARALQYAFFSERRAAVIGDIEAGTQAMPVNTLGVVGAGTMGGGIALTALNAGIRTVLVESNPQNLDRAVSRIRTSLEQAVQKGRITATEAERRLALLSPAADYAALGCADVIIEAVFEDLEVKRQVFLQLDAVAAPTAILATNTSTLDVDLIAAVTPRSASTVGLHFFSPAHVMRLLEVVRGARTSDAALVTVMTLAKRLGKTAVISGVCDGFIGNRMFEEYLRQAYFLLEEGATPLQVDQALERFGMAMGPFAVMDLAGGDIGWAIRKRRAIERPGDVYSKIPDRICELGRFGQKTGAGYYLYDAKGKRIPDPDIDELVIRYCAEIGLTRRAVSDEEIVERCVFALVNEGARLRAEGICQRTSDIDVVYRNGYGFPAHRGGPMHYADEVGLPHVIGRMTAFHAGYQGRFWEPAPLILDCSARAARLSDA